MSAKKKNPGLKPRPKKRLLSPLRAEKEIAAPKRLYEEHCHQRRCDQRVQGLDWALLDIFPPSEAEYHGEEHDFGSLWIPWLDAIVAAAKALKNEQSSALPGFTECC